MITITVPFDKPLNQKTYENIINTLQFHQLQCTCGHSGYLTIHGYYTRSLKKDDSEISLSICHVKCSHCGRIHALLPSLLVPYSQVSLQNQISIISAYEICACCIRATIDAPIPAYFFATAIGATSFISKVTKSLPV
jgi:hypothetical protein